MVETTISDFRTSFYIPAIPKLAFYLPHVCILGTNHYGEMQRMQTNEAHPVSKYQPSKSWPFIYHMCAYFVQITVVKCDAQPSNDMNYFKMFYVV